MYGKLFKFWRSIRFYGSPKFKQLKNQKNRVESNVPIVGGNVSLYNTTDDVSIRPTPVLMMLGIN